MEVPDPWALAWKELNDQGNADRLVAHAGGMLLFVRGWGWIAYDTAHWSREDGERLARLKAMDVARGMRSEMEALTERLDSKRLPDGMTTDLLEGRIEALSKHAVKSGDAGRTKSMLEQASNLDIVARRLEQFDTDLHTLNAANKTLRFRKGEAGWEIRASDHDPVDLLTRVTGCDYDPAAPCETWVTHMGEVLPNPETRRYFQKIIGYCALGLTIEQIFIMLQGKGGDGKSTTMNVIRMILGSYAVVGNVQTFLEGAQRAAGDATPELMRFVGDTRLVSLQEPKRSQALAEARVKQFTGGSPITARANYGDEIEFDPRGKVIMEVNSRPRISGDDDGIWRRIVIILFPRQFKGAAIDKRKTERLLDERAGILNWIIEGALAYLNEGLEQPPEVMAAIEEYRRSANPFSEWMAARVDLGDPTALELSSALYADYKTWCEAEGVGDRELMTSTAFGRALGDRQILLGPKNGKGLKQRRGARLRADNDLIETAPPLSPRERAQPVRDVDDFDLPP